MSNYSCAVGAVENKQTNKQTNIPVVCHWINPNSLITNNIHMHYCKPDVAMCCTESQQTEAHDNLLAGHHPSDDAPQNAVIADECDERLRKFSIAADIHRDTAVEHWDRLTASMKKNTGSFIFSG